MSTEGSGTQLLGSVLPLIVAPMAGGTSRPELVTAVARAGGFAFVAGGYRTAAAMFEEIEVVRAETEAFGVNVFVPGPNPLTQARFRAYAEELRDEGQPFGLSLDQAPMIADDDDDWTGKVDALLERPVPVVSFTFGIPPGSVIAALRRAGSRVLITVTSTDEARGAVEAGSDGLIVQSVHAGGHSGIHDPERALSELTTRQLVTDVAAVSAVPVVAAGGVAGRQDVNELMAAGAVAVMAGTLFLRTDESGASKVHKDALADPLRTRTVITKAFTGRPARGLLNAFIARHEATAPSGYPAVHHLTRPLRSAAAAAGVADQVHLWAGTGYRAARTGPAAEVLRDLTAGL